MFKDTSIKGLVAALPNSLVEMLIAIVAIASSELQNDDDVCRAGLVHLYDVPNFGTPEDFNAVNSLAAMLLLKQSGSQRYKVTSQGVIVATLLKETNLNVPQPERCKRCGREDQNCTCHPDDCNCEGCTTASLDRDDFTCENCKRKGLPLKKKSPLGQFCETCVEGAKRMKELQQTSGCKESIAYELNSLQRKTGDQLRQLLVALTALSNQLPPELSTSPPNSGETFCVVGKCINPPKSRSVPIQTIESPANLRCRALSSHDRPSE